MRWPSSQVTKALVGITDTNLRPGKQSKFTELTPYRPQANEPSFGIHQAVYQPT